MLLSVNRIVPSRCDLLLRCSTVGLTVAANRLTCTLAVHRLHWVVLREVGLVVKQVRGSLLLAMFTDNRSQAQTKVSVLEVSAQLVKSMDFVIVLILH